MGKELKKFISIGQAAKLLQVHPNTLRLWDKDGTLPAFRINSKKIRRYRKEDIEVFLEKNTINSLSIIGNLLRDFPIAENSPDMVVLMNTRGSIRYINNSCIRRLGFTPKEILGKSITDFTHPEDLLRAGSWKNVRNFHGRVMTKGGEWIWCEGSTFSFPWKGEEFICGIFRDITNRLKLEEQLKQSESRLKSLIRHAEAGIYEIDFRGPKFISVNDAMCTLSGYTRKELLKLDPNILLDSGSRKIFKERMIRHLSGRDISESVDYTVIRKDGKKINVVLHISPTYENGKPAGAFVIGYDVTRQKEMELAVKTSEEKYRNIVETAYEGIVIGQPDGKISFVNQQFADMLGYTREEIIGKSGLDFMSPDQKRLVLRSRDRLRRGKKFQGEFKFIRRDGSVLWTLASSSQIFDSEGNYVSNLALHTDITTRKMAEEALVASENRLRDIFENIPITLAVIELDGTIRQVNKAAVTMHGLHSEKELTGKNMMALVDRQFHKDVEKAWNKVMKCGRAENIALVQLGKNNKKINTLVSAIMLHNHEGKPDKVLAMVQNVTERNRIEASLKEREEKYRYQAMRLQAILDSAPAIIWIALDRECRIIVGNKAAYEFVRAEQGENMSRTGNSKEKSGYYQMMKNRKILKPEEMPIQRVVASGKPLFDYEVDFLFDDGTTRTLMGNIIPIFDVNKVISGAVAAFIDITDRKNMEMRKDEFINIASHELKTPLTSIKAYGQIIHKQITEEKFTNTLPLLVRMNSQINTLQSYISDLLDVSKIQAGKLVMKKVKTDIRQLIEDTCLTNKEILQNHPVKISARKCILLVDKELISQVLVNLISNASKYSEGKKPIIITVQRNSHDVRVLVKDYGIGVPKGVQKRIFERFFQVGDLDRTKYGGLGIGLYISKNIVEAHGGKIWVDSQPGLGSEFNFTIPVHS